jgi:hypothetical protein
MSHVEPPVEPEASGPLATDDAARPPQASFELPPARSIQAAPSLWWWFLVLALLIAVWVLIMMFMRKPLAPSSGHELLDAGSAGASP